MNKAYKVPLARVSNEGNEKKYVKEVLAGVNLAGDGSFGRRCETLLEKKFKAQKVLLTPSCTSAMEMASLLLGLGPGDEVIVPSFTFSSTVNAFMIFGAKPVFVDINPRAMNMDENLIEKLITKKTNAIYVLHYAGVGCEMDKIMSTARKYKLKVVEDAAQGVNAKYKDRYLGTIGDLGAYSFHESKNFVAGEGGALVINDPKLIKRAEIIREKGTNRSQFFRGEVDKYTWVDIGSSYLISELGAAFLLGQLEQIERIHKIRRVIYETYRKKLKPLEAKGLLKMSQAPGDRESNYHIFYLILNSQKVRNALMDYLKSKGVLAVFHYIPLHSAPMGRKLGYRTEDLPLTQKYAGRLIRLPIFARMKRTEQTEVILEIKKFFV